jgi:hypothetical protein
MGSLDLESSFVLLTDYVLQGRHPDDVDFSLRTFIEDGGARLKQLLSRLSAQGMRAFRFPKVHPSEISTELLETLGFRPAGAHRLYTATARSD